MHYLSPARHRMSGALRPARRSVRLLSIRLAAAAGVLSLPGSAYAHGANAAEMAPPIITSGLLGFVCYWLVILWPASKRAASHPDRFAVPVVGPQPIRIKRKPRLRVIASEAPEMQTRRVADG